MVLVIHLDVGGEHVAPMTGVSITHAQGCRWGDASPMAGVSIVPDLALAVAGEDAAPVAGVSITQIPGRWDGPSTFRTLAR